jgi:hypothetical protein
MGSFQFIPRNTKEHFIRTTLVMTIFPNSGFKGSLFLDFSFKFHECLASSM